MTDQSNNDNKTSIPILASPGPLWLGEVEEMCERAANGPDNEPPFYSDRMVAKLEINRAEWDTHWKRRGVDPAPPIACVHVFLGYSLGEPKPLDAEDD